LEFRKISRYLVNSFSEFLSVPDLRIKKYNFDNLTTMSMSTIDQKTLEEELAEFRINPFDFDEVRQRAAKTVLEDYDERVLLRTRKPIKKARDPLEEKRNQEAGILRDALRDRRADQKVKSAQMKEEWKANIDKNVQEKMVNGGGFDRRLLRPIRPFQGWVRGEDPQNLPHELTAEGWASPTRSLPPVERANQMRRSSQPAVGSAGPVAWGRRTLHKNGLDVYTQRKNIQNDDDDETMSVHTVEDEETHGPITYSPDDMFSTPHELQHQWVPNYTQMPTPRTPRHRHSSNEERGTVERGPRITTPGSPSSRKMSPEEDRRRTLELESKGETKDGHSYPMQLDPLLHSPRTQRKRPRGGGGGAMKYSDGHGSATLSMDAQEGHGLKSRQHLQQQRQQHGKQQYEQRQHKRRQAGTTRAPTGASTMSAGSVCNIWIPDVGWERSNNGHGDDKLKAVVKRRLKNNKYEVIYPDKSLRIYNRDQIIAVEKTKSNSAKDGWNEANQSLTHDHFFNRALSYNTLRSNDSLQRERMIAKRRLQLKLSRKHAEGPAGKDDPISYEQRQMEQRTMPGHRFASLGLFPNTVHDPMAVFENGEGKTGRDILNKKRRKYEAEKQKRQHFADHYKPSGKNVAEGHVHEMLKKKVAAERSHELARMVIANNLNAAKILVSDGADPNLEDWMDFDRTALHYAAMFGSLESVVWLVEAAGADPSVEDSTHATPLALAEQRGRPEVAEYLSEWTTERLRALHEAQATAKKEAEERMEKHAARNNARKSLMFLGNITKTGMKHQYDGPEIDQVQSGQDGDEENLVQAILALKKSPMGNKLNFMELARMLRPKVGDIWSDRVWDAMRAHVAAPTAKDIGPEGDDDGDDESDEDNDDLIGEALAELGKYLGGAFERVTMQADAADIGPAMNDEDDTKSDHGDEIEEARRIHAKKAALPDNKTAQKWRAWVKRRAQRKKELLPVGYIGWVDPEAIEEEHVDAGKENKVGALEEETETIVEEVQEEEIQPDGTIMTRWVKKTKTIVKKKKMVEQIVTPTKPVVVDESAQAFAAMALQCLLNGSALNANMLRRTMGHWAIPTLHGRFTRWRNNVKTRKFTKSILIPAIKCLEKIHLRHVFNQWYDGQTAIRDFVHKRNLLWRTISYKTRKAMARAFDKMKQEEKEEEWEMEESLDGGKTWIKKSRMKKDTPTKKRRKKGPTMTRKKRIPAARPKRKQSLGTKKASTIQKGSGMPRKVKKMTAPTKKKGTNSKKLKKDSEEGKSSVSESEEDETTETDTAEKGTTPTIIPVTTESMFTGNGWWNNSLAQEVLPTLDRPEKEVEKEKEQDEEEEEEEESDNALVQSPPSIDTTPQPRKQNTKKPPVSPLKRKQLAASKKKVAATKKNITKKKKIVDTSSEEESSSEDESSSSEESSSEEDTESDSESDSEDESSSSLSSSPSDSDRGVPQKAVDALKKELMEELKKSRQESEQLRKTVEDQQKQFGQQQDVITRQQAQITGLLVAKEAAEVAKQKQEKRLLRAREQTDHAIALGKKEVEKARRNAMLEAQKEAAEQARLLRKRAAQMLTGAAMSTGAAFYEAMEKRKQQQEKDGIVKNENDLDDLIEALRIDDEEAGITPKTTARREDSSEEEEEEDGDDEMSVKEDTDDDEETAKDTFSSNINNDGLIKAVRRVKKAKKKQKQVVAPNVIIEEKDIVLPNKNDIDIHKAVEDELYSDISSELMTGENEASDDTNNTDDDDDDEEEEEEDLDENGEPKTEEGKKKKRKRLAKKQRRKRRKRKSITNIEESSDTTKKKVRAKLDTSGVQIKRGSGFKMPKYHVRQFRHPREMEMALLQAEKTIEDLTIKLENTTDALLYTQDELMTLKGESENGSRSARESGTDTEDVNGVVMYTKSDGLPTTKRQEQIQLVLDGITTTVEKTLNKVGSSRKGTPRTGRKSKGKDKKDDKKNSDNKKNDDVSKQQKQQQQTNEKLTTEEAQAYERQLEKWVQEKLNKWDKDDAFRKKRKKKFKTKELFEESLRAKTKKQLEAKA
jgi:hypothetical protein